VQPDGDMVELPERSADRELAAGQRMGSRSNGGGGYGRPMSESGRV